ncbi:Tlg2-vesicle protein [Phlyctochytrium planicorne]|nr:Tlg2-vesicle protein [Phlyctochytrium planicorne]
MNRHPPSSLEGQPAFSPSNSTRPSSTTIHSTKTAPSSTSTAKTQQHQLQQALVTSSSSSSIRSFKRNAGKVDKKKLGGRFHIRDLKVLFQKEFIVGWIIVITAIVVTTLLVVFRKSVIPPLIQFANTMRSYGVYLPICHLSRIHIHLIQKSVKPIPSGAILIGALEFVASFPPMFGFGSLQLLAGFIYGMAGFIPIYLGGFLGGIACFAISRRYLTTRYRAVLTEKYPKFVIIEEAIQEGGLKLVILLRIAPYPYAIMNGVLSTTSIPFHRFAIATSICMFKALIQVYLGTTLQNLADLISGSTSRSDRPPTVEISIMLAGVVLAVAAIVYVSWLVRRTLRKYTGEDAAEEAAELGVRNGGDGDDAGGEAASESNKTLNV